MGWEKLVAGTRVRLVGGALPPAVETKTGNVQLLMTRAVSGEEGVGDEEAYCMQCCLRWRRQLVGLWLRVQWRTPLWLLISLLREMNIRFDV